MRASRRAGASSRMGDLLADERSGTGAPRVRGGMRGVSYFSFCPASPTCGMPPSAIRHLIRDHRCRARGGEAGSRLADRVRDTTLSGRRTGLRSFSSSDVTAARSTTVGPPAQRMQLRREEDARELGSLVGTNECARRAADRTRSAFATTCPGPLRSRHSPARGAGGLPSPTVSRVPRLPGACEVCVGGDCW